jgi:diguanylate cyclase (GGDEF)-like protein
VLFRSFIASSSLRQIDVIARIGGDEFCIVIDDIKDLTTVDAITKNLMNEFSSPFVINKHPLEISVSIGISIYPGDTADIDTLFKFADSALYIAKSSGRNNYKYFKEI